SERSGSVEVVQQPLDLQIRSRNLRIVGARRRRGKPRAYRRGRVVRSVGFVQVHPREERLAAILVYPTDRLIDHLRSRMLDRIGTNIGRVLRQIEIVEIPVET